MDLRNKSGRIGTRVTLISLGQSGPLAGLGGSGVCMQRLMSLLPANTPALTRGRRGLNFCQPRCTKRSFLLLIERNLIPLLKTQRRDLRKALKMASRELGMR